MSHLDIAGSAGSVEGGDALPEGTPMREWLAGALATACDGEVSAEEILRADSPFVALGITSIAMVRLIDAIEAELDVFIELGGDTWFLKDLDSLDELPHRIGSHLKNRDRYFRLQGTPIRETASGPTRFLRRVRGGPLTVRALAGCPRPASDQASDSPDPVRDRWIARLVVSSG